MMKFVLALLLVGCTHEESPFPPPASAAPDANVQAMIDYLADDLAYYR
jgi:hypothetical protein